MFFIKNKKKIKNEPLNLIPLKFNINSYNLNTGDEANIKCTMLFDEKKALKTVIGELDKKFNLNSDRDNYSILYNNVQDIWKQHGFKNIWSIENDILEMKIKNLNKLFDLNKFVFSLTFGGGVGGGVGRINGTIFVIHANETKQHHEKHIHVKKSGKEMVVSLETLNKITGSLDNKKDEIRAIKHIKNNQEGLLKEWNYLQSGIIHKEFKMSFDWTYTD